MMTQKNEVTDTERHPFGFFTYPNGGHVLVIDEKRYQVTSWSEAVDILNRVILKDEKE